MKSDRTPNHALQRTAPRVTARAFCERSGSSIWASVVRSTVGHAPRHAPPSLSLGSFARRMNRIAFLVALFLVACHEKKYDNPNTKPKMMNEAIPGKNITIHQLEAMFNNIKEKSDWNLSEKMLWGYFFTNHEPKALEAVRQELVRDGYRFVDLYQSGQDDQDGPPKWWLHVEREEIHTPQTLDQRNDVLYLLAARHGVDSYDGMDIGPIENQEGEQD